MVDELKLFLSLNESHFSTATLHSCFSLHKFSAEGTRKTDTEVVRSITSFSTNKEFHRLIQAFLKICYGHIDEMYNDYIPFKIFLCPC